MSTLRLLALELAYRGSDFHGWQRQPGERTVQGEVERWCRRLCNEELGVVTAGRTDSGVHARASLCTFRTTSTLSGERLLRGLRKVLPADIRAIRLHGFEDLEFSARFSARWRRYGYRICEVPDPFRAPTAWCLEGRLDHERMEQALKPLSGRTDCRAFCVTQSLPEAAICWFHSAGITREGEEWVLRLQADRFLHSQVRSTAGTLVAIGQGKVPVTRIAELLQSGERAKVGPTAPPQGLFLEAVGYPRFRTGLPLTSHGMDERVMQEGETAGVDEPLPALVHWKGPSHGTREQAIEAARQASGGVESPKHRR